MTTISSAVTVERIEDPAGLADLREEWRDLLAASPADCLFLTWEWLSTWWKHLGGRRQLHLLLVRDGGVLAAIAPLTRRPPVLRRLLLTPALEFLGTGTVGSDYLDVIVRSGRERMVLDALTIALADTRFMLELSQVDRASSFAVALVRRLVQRGWRMRETKVDVCPIIGLEGHSWESYLASLGVAHRYNFKQRLRAVEKSFDVQLNLVQTDAERREALEALATLQTRRWHDKGGSEAFGNPELRGFYDEFSRLALQRGWLRLFVLRLNGRAVAVHHGYQYGRTFYSYQSGFDLTLAKRSVGLVTMGLTIRQAIREGAVECDLLHGAEPYKFHWARFVREVGRLEMFAPGVRGAVYRRLAVACALARKTVRQSLGNGLADWIRGRRVTVPATPDSDLG